MPGQNTNAGNGANNNTTPASSGSSNAPSSTGTKNQLEQLNTMREALFSQDGWGYQHVNQDTNWEVSVSPEPQQKDNQPLSNTSSTGATQLWKPNINNGTELWEANLRNGGQPPVQIPVQKTPWGHTPSTNLGGTWGEDDDGAESSNVWARGPVESSSVGVGNVSNQWGQQHNANSTAPATNTWTDVREIVQRQNTLELHRPSTNPTNTVTDLQPRNVTASGDPIRAILEQREPIRGDPRGISGRLNGTPEMWGQIPQLQQHQTQNQLKVQNTGQWTTAPEKPTVKPPTIGSGWEEPSPPPQRRNIPNYDDGTSLWSQQNRWKQQEENRSSHILRANANSSNTNNTTNRSQKNDNSGMWGGRSNNSAGNNNGGGNQWETDNDNSTNNTTTNSDWNKPSKLTSNWDEPSSSAVASSNAAVGSNWELKNAQHKVHGLLNMGFKKEDVERALIASNMNFDEALEYLSNNWRRPEPEPTVNYDRSYGRVVGSSVPPQFPTTHVQQKYSGFGQQPNAIVATALNNVGGGNSTSSHSQEPTAQQLRMLVQQIQMAVQSGYLSSQILNQPLAPATLVLLNQLLTSIKHLQGAQSSVQRGNNMNSMQISVTIAKYKQQITSLQSQINAQQAIYIKQQQIQQQQQNQHVGSNEFIRNHHEAISALQGNFNELNLSKQSGYQSAPTNQQSRLNQWKLPVLDSTDNTDFSRAPGATTKTTNSLGIQDGTWTSCRNLSDGWADSTNDNENKDWPTTQASPAPAFTDLVPEFEPGKPWKGSQMKSIEDDPSITPGSVARSPLSINPMPKDAAEIFTTNQTNKNSPTDLPPLSLSSTTWSFNPTNLSNQNFASWSDTSSVQQNATAAELWGAPINKTSRGPPPGLGSGSKNVAGGLNKSSANGWIGSGRGTGNSGAVSWASSGNTSWNTNSNWLLLKNLNNQIDGSTLCTLCKQHGPLLNFQLYLNQGIALCKYTTREEAQKAQMALNNCVLGNTTISVESPNETDVQNILQHFPLVNSGGNNGNNVPTNSGNSGNGNSSRQQQQVRSVGGPGGPPADSWSANSVWQTGGTSSSSLWTLETSSSGNGGNQNERTTPSNLKSLLPENLLELN